MTMPTNSFWNASKCKPNKNCCNGHLGHYFLQYAAWVTKKEPGHCFDVSFCFVFRPCVEKLIFSVQKYVIMKIRHDKGFFWLVRKWNIYNEKSRQSNRKTITKSHEQECVIPHLLSVNDIYRNGKRLNAFSLLRVLCRKSKQMRKVAVTNAIENERKKEKTNKKYSNYRHVKPQYVFIP